MQLKWLHTVKEYGRISFRSMPRPYVSCSCISIYRRSSRRPDIGEGEKRCAGISLRISVRRITAENPIAKLTGQVSENLGLDNIVNAIGKAQDPIFEPKLQNQKRYA